MGPAVAANAGLLVACGELAASALQYFDGTLD